MDQDSFSRAVGPLARRGGRMAARAILGLTRLIKGRQVAQTQRFAEETRDETEVLQQYGFASRPHPGAEGIAIALGGDPSHQVIVATDDARHRFGPLKTGEVAIYDDQSQHVYLYRDGIRVRDKHGNEVLTGAGGISITSPMPVKVTAPQVVVESADLQLGAGDLRPVARVGDSVVVDGKSGQITSGAATVRAG